MTFRRLLGRISNRPFGSAARVLLLFLVIASAGTAIIATAGADQTASLSSRAASAQQTYWISPTPENGQTRVRPRALVLSDQVPKPEAANSNPLLLFSKLRWDDWGGAEAHGTGTVVRQAPGVDRVAFNVTVTMSDRIDCHGWQVYSSFTAQLTPGETGPTDWDFSRAQRGVTRGCWPGPTTCAVGMSACLHKNLYFGVNLHPFGTTNHIQDVAFSDWGGASPVGDGIMLAFKPFDGKCRDKDRIGTEGGQRGECPNWFYPVRIAYSKLKWCQRGIRYTRQVTTKFGKGIPVVRRNGRVPSTVSGPLRRRILAGIRPDATKTVVVKQLSDYQFGCESQQITAG